MRAPAETTLRRMVRPFSGVRSATSPLTTRVVRRKWAMTGFKMTLPLVPSTMAV